MSETNAETSQAFDLDRYIAEEIGEMELVEAVVHFGRMREVPEAFYRALIRACLRELDEEREAVREGVSAIDLVLTDRCVGDEERTEVAGHRDALGRLLPDGGEGG